MLPILSVRVDLIILTGTTRVIRIRIGNLMQVSQGLELRLLGNQRRRVVAAEHEDSSWRSMLFVHVFRSSIYAVTKYGGSVMITSLEYWKEDR